MKASQRLCQSGLLFRKCSVVQHIIKHFSTSLDSMNCEELCSIAEYFFWHLRDVAVRTFCDKVKELSIKILAIGASELEIFNKYIWPDVQLNAQQQMILKAKYLFKAILNASGEINLRSLEDWHEKISIRFQEEGLMQIILKRGYSLNFDCLICVRHFLKKIESTLKFTTYINVTDIAQSMRTRMLKFQTKNRQNHLVTSVEKNLFNEINQELELLLTKYAKKESAKLEKHYFQSLETFAVYQPTTSAHIEAPNLNNLQNINFHSDEESSQFDALMHQQVNIFHSNEPMYQQTTQKHIDSTNHDYQNNDLLNEPICHVSEEFSDLQNSHQNSLFNEGPIEFESQQVIIITDTIEPDGSEPKKSALENINISNDETIDCTPIIFEQSLAYKCSFLPPSSPKPLPMTELHNLWCTSLCETVAQKVLSCKEREMIKVKRLTCNEANCTDVSFKKKDFYKHLLSKHQIMRHRCHHKECKMNFAKKIDLITHIHKIHLFKASSTYRCSLCQKIVPYQMIGNHFRMWHETGSFKCANCNFVSNTRQKVKRHFLAHIKVEHSIAQTYQSSWLTLRRRERKSVNDLIKTVLKLATLHADYSYCLLPKNEL